jgi:DNA-binding Lrp family transcriptional regulator
MRLVKQLHTGILAAGCRVSAAPEGRSALIFGAGVNTAADFEQDPWSSIASTGRPDFFVVALHVERERADLLAQLRKWLAAEENVQQVFYVAGEADFILVITCADTGAYDVFMSRMVRENPNVRRFNTHVALSVPKRGLTIPVPLNDASTSPAAG